MPISPRVLHIIATTAALTTPHQPCAIFGFGAISLGLLIIGSRDAADFHNTANN
jgi:uncharacterized protein YigA (DUF484 family)